MNESNLFGRWVWRGWAGSQRGELVDYVVLRRPALLVLRPMVRVLVVDDLDRLLLFRAVDEAGGAFWFPAGAGLRTARPRSKRRVGRSRRKQVGSGVELEAEVLHRRHVVAWGGVAYDICERWFLARVAAFTVDTGGFTEEERQAGHFRRRWWTYEGFAGATERLVPSDLAARYHRLFEDGPAGTPTEIGV